MACAVCCGVCCVLRCVARSVVQRKRSGLTLCLCIVHAGIVQKWLDLRSVLPADRLPSALQRDAVLNGIAFEAGARRLVVTGKLWPVMLELELQPLLPQRPRPTQ